MRLLHHYFVLPPFAISEPSSRSQLGETRRQSADTGDSIGVLVPIGLLNDDPAVCLRSSMVHTWVSWQDNVE